jgi:hypothetical protein
MRKSNNSTKNNRAWQPEMPILPGLYLWREESGGYEHSVEIGYEQASSGELARFMRCYSLTDFADIKTHGEWMYVTTNLTPKVSSDDIALFSGAEGWSVGFPSNTGGYLWRQQPGEQACRVDIRDAILLSGQPDRLVVSHGHHTPEEFATLRTQGQWARPESLRHYVSTDA